MIRVRALYADDSVAEAPLDDLASIPQAGILVLDLLGPEGRIMRFWGSDNYALAIHATDGTIVIPIPQWDDEDDGVRVRPVADPHSRVGRTINTARTRYPHLPATYNVTVLRGASARDWNPIFHKYMFLGEDF